MMALRKNVILRSAQRARLDGRTTDAMPFLFIIAGEPSGDALGAALIAALRERTPGRLRIAGIGGEAMAEQGLASPLPLPGLAAAPGAARPPPAPLILSPVSANRASSPAARLVGRT